MTSAEPVIDLTALIDQQNVGWFHVRIILLCGLCCFGSGFFTVALGFVAPMATAALTLKAGALGPAFAAMGFGSILGSFICTPLADRFGRKPVVIAGMLLAVPFLFLMARATSVTELIWMQFFAGFGLIGLMPIALALAGEFMPKHWRVTLTMLVWVGFNIGSIVTGFVAAWIASGYDWHLIFVINGILPLAIAPVIAWMLPESLDFLAERHTSGEKIARILMQLAPATVILRNTRFVLNEKEEHGFSVSLLFREERTRLTLQLWVMFFGNMIALIFMNSWLATVLHGIGIPAALAIVIAASTNAGGIIGGIVISELCDRYEEARFYILAAAYILGGVFIAAIAYSGKNELAAFAATFMVGFFTYGAQNTANAVAATIYPTAMRSTGAGWAIGIGNSAQIVSPLLGGLLLSLQWSPATILDLLAFPTSIAALAASLIGLSAHRSHAESVAKVI